MAARSLQQIRAKVTCSKCDNLFEEPVTLSCLHSYCKKCLVDVLEKNGAETTESLGQGIRENLKANACDPNLCKELSNLNAVEVAKLPTNHTLENIISQIKFEDEIRSEEGTKCEECVGKPTAIYYCKECRKALCKECKEYHAKRQETSKHNPQSLEEIRSESKTDSYPGVQDRVTWKCHEHKDQDVTFYCLHHDVLICSHCAITAHKQTECDIKMTKRVFEVKEELKTDLTEQVAQTEGVHEKFVQAVTDIEEMLKTLEGSKVKARREIEERHQKMVEELARQKEELLHTTDEIFSRKEKNLEEQLQELHRIKAALRNPIDLTNDIVGVGIHEEILYFRKMLQERLKQLFDDYDPYNRDPRDNDIVTFKDSCLDLTKAIGTVTGDPHISEFTLEDPPLQDLHLFTGEEGSFKVRSRDIVGGPLLEVPHELVVDIQLNGEEDAEIIRGAVEKDKEGGFYKVTITPQQPGKHTLRIFVNIRDTQVHIKGSPFELKVIPPFTLEHERVIQNEKLNSPCGIAMSNDKKQIVVTNVEDHHLILFDEHFTFVRVVGKKGAGELEFNDPRGVAFNPVNGQLVVVEKDNNRVQILSAEFEFVSMFGERGGGEGMFCKPTCIAVNKDGQIFVTDRMNQRIQFFKPDGTPLGVIGGSIEGYGQALGKFNEPYAIVIDDQDEMFVTEYSGSRVQMFHKVDNDTWYRSEFQFRDIQKPVGIAYDAENRYIFVSEQDKQCISIFSRTGQFFTSFGSLGNGQNQFKNPMGLAVLGEHRLMVADCLNNRLVVFKY